jgi:hypothetical protein
VTALVGGIPHLLVEENPLENILPKPQTPAKLLKLWLNYT